MKQIIGEHSETEIAWLAGLLEGEGSFMYARTGNYRRPIVVVKMTDQDVIDKVSNMFGTKTYAPPRAAGRPTWKQMWRAQVSGAKAVAWMHTLRPWMGKRRGEKIDEILREYGGIERIGVRAVYSNSKSGVTGVTWSAKKQMWRVRGSYFATVEEAKAAA